MVELLSLIHILAGVVIGILASLLVFFGNPVNMGFCIACFLRDTAGALGLHSAAPVQYIRPEIIGLVLGSFLLALTRKELSARGGSAPLTRFVLGFFVMIGCLMFLGCPFRMILRLAGGDLNALFGLGGFVCGILAGVFFLNRGYSLRRTYRLPALEGLLFPVLQVVLLLLLVAAPSPFSYTHLDVYKRQEFGDVDAIPLCVDTKDVDKLVETIALLSKSFGGINLEDIAAPRCFEVERRLKEICDIPVFHDDQHGTAIVVAAAMLNACLLYTSRCV